MTLHVGTMGWSYAFWRGGFYPKDFASEDFLSYYAKRLGSVEVDNTFYRIPRAENVADWKRQVPAHFVFSLKFPAKITHLKLLRDAQEETSLFLDRVSDFGEKLGALLLQMPPQFGEKHVIQLRDFLKTLPKGKRYAMEIRNKSLLKEAVYGLLRDNNVALVWVDAAKMPLIQEVTADFLYVRWVGDRKAVRGTLGKIEEDKSKQIEEWADRLKPNLDRGLEVYGYFSKYYSGSPTSDAEALIEKMQT